MLVFRCYTEERSRFLSILGLLWRKLHISMVIRTAVVKNSSLWTRHRGRSNNYRYAKSGCSTFKPMILDVEPNAHRHRYDVAFAAQDRDTQLGLLGCQRGEQSPYDVHVCPFSMRVEGSCWSQAVPYIFRTDCHLMRVCSKNQTHSHYLRTDFSIRPRLPTSGRYKSNRERTARPA